MLLAALAMPLSCARIRPPSGGPVDKTPPELSGSLPEDGSIGNGALDEVTLRFSEAVERQSVLEALRVSPRRLIRGVRWEGDTLLAVRFWQALPADTSVDLFLVPGWRDRHRVEQPQWQVASFATGDSLLSGWLGGKVTFKGNASRGLHLRLSDGESVVGRAGRPDHQGNFVFRHLPADGRDWTLTAYQDVDGDSLYDPAVDFADSLADSLRLTIEAPRRLDLVLNVIDPHEPGRVAGSFGAPERGDSLGAAFFIRLIPDSLRLAGGERPLGPPGAYSDSLLTALAPLIVWRAEADSLRAAGLRAEAVGGFSFESVPPGSWWLFAHRDLGVEDSIWDPAREPAFLDPGPRLLAPGGELTWSRFMLAGQVDSLDSGGTEP